MKIKETRAIIQYLESGSMRERSLENRINAITDELQNKGLVVEVITNATEKYLTILMIGREKVYQRKR